MGGHSSRSCSFPESIPPTPPPIPDLRCVGICTPDVSGIFVHDGDFDGKPAYRREDGLYWIWWDSEFPSYVISAEKGGEVEDYYQENIRDETPEGTYAPVLFAEGNPVVSAIN